MRALLLGLLLLAIAGPASANVVETFGQPFQGVPFWPQLSCTFAFDTGGLEHCEHEGALQRAGLLSIRIEGAAARVVAFADDVSSGAPRLLAFADCRVDCTRPFPMTTTNAGRLFVEATGSPNAIVIVSVEGTLDNTLDRV